MEIVKYPAPSLFRKSKPVEKVDYELLTWVKEFVDFTQQPLGMRLLGMAAPQVGRNIRLFIAMGRIYVNPELVWVTNAPKTLYKEGCFSLEHNKFDYEVYRATSIRLKWEDLTGATFEERFNGQKAQVILHELDHLDGVMCIAKPEKDGIVTKETKTNDGIRNKRLASKATPRKRKP